MGHLSDRSLSDLDQAQVVAPDPDSIAAPARERDLDQTGARDLADPLFLSLGEEHRDQRRPVQGGGCLRRPNAEAGAWRAEAEGPFARPARAAAEHQGRLDQDRRVLGPGLLWLVEGVGVFARGEDQLAAPLRVGLGFGQLSWAAQDRARYRFVSGGQYAQPDRGQGDRGQVAEVSRPSRFDQDLLCQDGPALVGPLEEEVIDPGFQAWEHEGPQGVPVDLTDLSA